MPKLPNYQLTQLPNLLDQLFRSAAVFFRIDSYGVKRRFCDVDVHAILEKAQLFQSFGSFQAGLRPTAESIQRRLAVGIKAKVLEILNAAASIAIKWDGMTGKVKRA